MMKRIIVLGLMSLVIIAVGISAKADAQGNEDILKVSLKDAVDMALKASEDVQISENEIARSTSEFREEKAEIFPHISGLVTWSNNYEYPDIAATAATKDYSLDLGITIDQTLWDFGRISSAIKAVEKELETSQWNKKVTKDEVVYIARIAYYNTCLVKRTLEITEESYKNAQENKKILENRAASGRVSKYDNIKISSDIAARLPAVSTARAGYNSALQTLKMIIGVSPEVAVGISHDYEEEYRKLQIEFLVDKMQVDQPTVKALEAAIAANEYTVREMKAEYLPEISAFSTWNHKGVGNDSSMGSNSLDDYGVLGIKVDLSIWEGGSRKEELEQARIDKSNSELLKQKEMKSLLRELYTTVEEYHEFIKTLDANMDAVRLAQEAFKMSQDLFRSGQISVTDLNDSELLLTQGKLNKERTLFNINATLAKIEKLTVMETNNE